MPGDRRSEARVRAAARKQETTCRFDYTGHARTNAWPECHGERNDRADLGEIDKIGHFRAKAGEPCGKENRMPEHEATLVGGRQFDH